MIEKIQNAIEATPEESVDLLEVLYRSLILERSLSRLTANVKPAVYIAGPYTKGDPVVNVRTAVLFGKHLRDTYGVVVFTPHLTMFEHFVAPEPYRYWLDMDLDVLARCDALYRLEGESSGADEEVAFAKSRHIEVFHDEESLAAWVREINAEV